MEPSMPWWRVSTVQLPMSATIQTMLESAVNLWVRYGLIASTTYKTRVVVTHVIIYPTVRMQIGMNGTTVIGSRNVSLFCNANEYPWPANFTSFMWSNQEGPIVDGDRLNITLLNTTYSSFQPNFISSLQFNPLTVTDGGTYLCRVTLNLTYPRDTVGIATNTTSIRLVVTGELKVHWAECVLYIFCKHLLQWKLLHKFWEFCKMKLVHCKSF